MEGPSRGAALLLFRSGTHAAGNAWLIRWNRNKDFFNFSGMRTKRRALVLTDESARHPFRARIPQHVRRVKRDLDVRSLTHGPGWRDFLTAYCASFVVVALFIA
jgi:hypothetical protein